MRHATMNALALVRGQKTEPRLRDVYACRTERRRLFEPIFAVLDALRLLDGLPPTDGAPTCPACAVLLDEALERRRT